MLWQFCAKVELGLGTKATLLGLEKDQVLAYWVLEIVLVSCQKYLLFLQLRWLKMVLVSRQQYLFFCFH